MQPTLTNKPFLIEVPLCTKGIVHNTGRGPLLFEGEMSFSSAEKYWVASHPGRKKETRAFGAWV